MFIFYIILGAVMLWLMYNLMHHQSRVEYRKRWRLNVFLIFQLLLVWFYLFIFYFLIYLRIKNSLSLILNF